VEQDREHLVSNFCQKCEEIFLTTLCVDSALVFKTTSNTDGLTTGLSLGDKEPLLAWERNLGMLFLMSSYVLLYRTLRMSSYRIPGGGEQIHEENRGGKGVSMSFGVGYRGDIAVENTQL
jgi:hypothetical protein